jgi:hypothetical protein
MEYHARLEYQAGSLRRQTKLGRRRFFRNRGPVSVDCRHLPTRTGRRLGTRSGRCRTGRRRFPERTPAGSAAATNHGCVGGASGGHENLPGNLQLQVARASTYRPCQRQYRDSENIQTLDAQTTDCIQHAGNATPRESFRQAAPRSFHKFDLSRKTNGFCFVRTPWSRRHDAGKLLKGDVRDDEIALLVGLGGAGLVSAHVDGVRHGSAR